MVFNVSARNWEEKVIKAEDPVVVVFQHKECPHSVKFEPILKELSKEYEDLKFAQLDVGKWGNSQIATFYGITRTPTLKFFFEGSVIGELIGYRSREELKKEIDRRVENPNESVKKSSALDRVSKPRRIKSEVEGIFYTPILWENAKETARQIIQEREEISFSDLAQEIKVETTDVKKIATELAKEMESIEVWENTVGRPRGKEVEYEGETLPEHEREALIQIEEEIGKKPKFAVKEKKTIRLNLLDAWVSDISPLQDLKYLRELNIGATNVSDLSPLQELKNLRELNIGATNVSDLSPLQELKNLRELYLWETDVTDLSPLKNLEKLEVLHLWETDISDLSPLKSLKNLRELDLRNTRVSDISPLQDLKNLEKIDLRGTEVDWRHDTVQVLVEERDVKVKL